MNLEQRIEIEKNLNRRKTLAFFLGVVIVTALISILVVVSYLSQTKAATVKQLSERVDHLEAVITGQTQLIKNQDEVITCLAVTLATHAGIDTGLKYDPNICKQRIAETNNFDGTFARDEIIAPQNRPNTPQSTPAPDNGTCVPLTNLCVKL